MIVELNIISLLLSLLIFWMTILMMKYYSSTQNLEGKSTLKYRIYNKPDNYKGLLPLPTTIPFTPWETRGKLDNNYIKKNLKINYKKSSPAITRAFFYRKTYGR